MPPLNFDIVTLGHPCPRCGLLRGGTLACGQPGQRPVRAWWRECRFTGGFVFQGRHDSYVQFCACRAGSKSSFRAFFSVREQISRAHDSGHIIFAADPILIYNQNESGKTGLAV
jgi:hypothetical protein